MGVHAEACATQFKFNREQQDQFALESLTRAQTATHNGAFDNEIIAVELPKEKITLDEGPQRIKAEKIPLLRPAFIENGTITAANASSIADGAAAVTLTTATYATQLSITPIARIIGHYTYAHQPAWFTTAPIQAIKGLLTKINWSIESVDLFEINEAFACVTMAAIHELNIAPERVNINGGACALGHPIGATGARILVTLIHALKNHQLQRGIAALCIGGGEASAIAIELIN